MKVLIDNGHGIDTPGKRSPVWPDGSQLLEWEFNRAIANEVMVGLNYLNISAHLLVPEPFDVSLTERVRRVNTIASSEKCVLISIHANAGGGTGWEVFTSPGETTSDKYAAILFDVARRLLPEFRMRADYADGDPDKEAEFYMLTKTICPAVLTENLFMDTEQDCRFILSKPGRNIISRIHIEGIKKIWDENRIF